MSANQIENLTAMPDADLNALAAELRGLTLTYSDHDSYRGVTGMYYFDGDSSDQEAFCSEGDWLPTADRNQSGELLQWAAVQKDAVFGVYIEGNFKRIDVGVPDPASQDQSGRILFDLEFTIEGNDARAETIAFCAAMLAMKEDKGEN